MEEKGFVSIYKDLIKRLVLLLINPTLAWKEAESEGVNQDVFLSNYLLPLMGVLAIVLFIVKGASNSPFSIIEGLKGGAFYFIAIFVTFYIVINLKDTQLAAFLKEDKGDAYLHLVGFTTLLPPVFGGIALLNYYLLPIYAFSIMLLPIFSVKANIECQKMGQKKSHYTMLLSLLLLTLPPLFYYILTIISRV